jgi:endonuclease III
MSEDEKQALVDQLLVTYPKTHARMAGIIVKSTPQSLYQLLVAATLMSARIKAELATGAAKAMFDVGWKTPRKLLDSTWKERVVVLNKNGYARYDESTSRMLEDSANTAMDLYGGDLRNLRDESDGDPEVQKKLLKQFKGMGEVGAEIYLREVQTAWEELQPFVDKKAQKAANRLGLGRDPLKLAGLAGTEDLSHLCSALVQLDLDGKLAYDQLKADASA